MKILQIITNLELGGAQKATLNLCRWLKDKEYEVSLVSSPQGLLYSDAKQILGSRFKVLKYLKRQINPIFDLMAFFSLYIFIKENNFDLVHTHTSKAGILGRWAAHFCFAPKIIHTVHGFAFHDYQNRFLKNLYILLERLTAVISDKIIAVSEGVKEKGIYYGIGEEKKYSVIYELVEIKGAKKNSLPRRNCFKIGMVGALKPQKAPQDFLKTALILSRRRKDVKFLLVGDGKLRPRLEKIIEEYNLGDNFKLLGWRRDIYRIMQEFDILVLPSIFEGQPHVVIEALAFGIPIVASAVDGVKDLIRDGENGLLVRPQKVFEIAEKVETLLNDRRLRERISERSYHYFQGEKKLDYFRNLAKIEKIYRELIGDSIWNC